MLESSDTLQVLCTAMLIFGSLWTLKKVADMERYHIVRVVVLTIVLSYFVTLFFCGLWADNLGCVVNFSSENVQSY